MMLRFPRTIFGAAVLTVLAVGVSRGLAQQGVAERVGQKLDQVGRGLKTGAVEITDAVRKKFETVRADVQRMGVPSRVYARLHWDKMLNTSRIEVHMVRGGAVLLRGVVPDEDMRKHAVELASATVDVTSVVDELTTLTPPAAITPPAVSSQPAKDAQSR
jgi:hyperosmotically inducible periplasmic protein